MSNFKGAFDKLLLAGIKLFLSIGLLNIPQSVFAHCKYSALKGDMKL